MEITGGEIFRNDTNQNAMGGSEIIATNLAQRLDPDLLKECQIVNSRVRRLENDKVRIFLAHDLAGDPESEFLKNGGHDVFHGLVFVSNWQMQRYIDHYNIPWSKCIVMENAIDPIPVHEKPTDVIRLGYWSTPHRGLNILVPVFNELCKKYDNLKLDVFSSFNLYGWEQRDEPYKEIFKNCKEHPKIDYHGSVKNEVIRSAVQDMHILAYPSIWQETSCIVLMEAMSAGLQCVHPNYGALHETAAGWTFMYQWTEDMQAHAQTFYHFLDNAIQTLNNPETQSMLATQKVYADIKYNWKYAVPKWNAYLEMMIDSIKDRSLPKEIFSYSAG